MVDGSEWVCRTGSGLRNKTLIWRMSSLYNKERKVRGHEKRCEALKEQVRLLITTPMMTYGIVSHKPLHGSGVSATTYCARAAINRDRTIRIMSQNESKAEVTKR